MVKDGRRKGNRYLLHSLRRISSSSQQAYSQTDQRQRFQRRVLVLEHLRVKAVIVLGSVSERLIDLRCSAVRDTTYKVYNDSVVVSLGRLSFSRHLSVLRKLAQSASRFILIKERSTDAVSLQDGRSDASKK